MSSSHKTMSKYGNNKFLRGGGFLQCYSNAYVENNEGFWHDLAQLEFDDVPTDIKPPNTQRRVTGRRLSALPPAQHTFLWLAHLLAAIAGVWILCYVVYHRCNPRKAVHAPTGTT